MKIREKLNLLNESDARNLESIAAHLVRQGIQKKIEAIHRSIEIYADSILESLDVLANYHGTDRSDLLEALIDTLQALEQNKVQEG